MGSNLRDRSTNPVPRPFRLIKDVRVPPASIAAIQWPNTQRGTVLERNQAPKAIARGNRYESGRITVHRPLVVAVLDGNAQLRLTVIIQLKQKKIIDLDFGDFEG